MIIISGVGLLFLGLPRLEVSRFTILSQFFVMLVFLFCKLFDHHSQTNFPIIKTKSFKVTKFKKLWQIFIAAISPCSPRPVAH